MKISSSHAEVTIRQVSEPIFSHLANLVEESESEGFRFLRKLVDDWTSGENRFTQQGEALFIAECDGQIVAVGGLNIDPYANAPTVGRVRRFYVAARFRRQKLGARMIEVIVDLAKQHFTTLRLYTNSEEAARFYLAVGFSSHYGCSECTHILQIK